jgi:uncharacterized protein
VVYLDTSVAIPMFVQEPNSDAVEKWFETSDAPLVSADWILTEFASALALKVRRRDLSTSQAAAARKEFEIFARGGLRLIAVTRQAFRSAADFSSDTASGLRSGDSLHLAVALEAGISRLISADRNLLRNAEAKGIAAIRV